MSVLLWYGEGENDAVSVGSILRAYPSFSEISDILKGEGGFDELQSVPGFAEQKVTKWWLTQVKQQAEKFLQKHGNKVKPQTSGMLRNLVQQIGKVRL